mmetsp:Transcript_36108/g.83994  ORF Transcript_36108/g.83994 Transcript_36108/m.83994 type:complete len:205 (-) Transcript_36108:1244-1858(-)
MQLGAGAPAQAQLVAGADEVMCDARRDHGVLLVLRVLAHKAPHPGRRREERAGRPALHQAQVAPQARERRGLAGDVLEVGVADGPEAGEAALPAIHDLVHAHLLGLCRLVVAAEIPAEPEPLAGHGPHGVRAAHVLVHLGEGHQHIEVEGQERSAQQHHEDHEGRVLKVRGLHLHRPELRAPADVRGAGLGHGRRLEAHGLPVR